MLRSLLVPLDGSTMSEWSLPLAKEVARASGAQLHLAHVHIPYEPDQLLSNTSFQWEGVDLHEYDVRHLDEEKAYLSGLEERLEATGMVVDSRVLEGPTVAEDLATYADEVHTDMIFMASHGRSGVKRARWGSVADEMIRRTTVPMLRIHPEAEMRSPDELLEIRHILVALDGSARAESVLGPTAELAKATGARLTLARVVWPPSAWGRRTVSPTPPEIEAGLDEAHRYLEGVAERMRARDLDVSVHTTHDRSPAVAIEALAGQLGADLIAIATHGYGGFKRAMLGSVADKLVRTCHRPLLVMRPALET